LNWTSIPTSKAGNELPQRPFIVACEDERGSVMVRRPQFQSIEYGFGMATQVLPV
jgi:hypothetical protein